MPQRVILENIADLIEGLQATGGQSLAPIHTTAAMTTTSATVLTENDSRTYALIVNDGTVPVYIKIGATPAVANEGIRIDANGGSYELSRLMGNLFTQAIVGITASGTATLIVTEAT